MIINKPIERIIERTYIEGYRGPENAPQRDTGPIQQIAFPPMEQRPERPIIVNVMQPTRPSGERQTYATRPPNKPDQKERTQHEPHGRDEIGVSPVAPERRTTKPQDQERVPDVAPVASSDPIPDTNNSGTEQKEFAEPNKNNSVEPTKTIPNNSPDRIDSELIEPDKPAPQASSDGFKQVGKVSGRQRSYDDIGENDIEPVREVFLLRHLTGKHWPGLSKDMESYYEKFYFSRPKKGSKYYARHVKCWERRTRWLAAHTAPSTTTV